MKQVSTVATKQTRNFSEQKLTIGRAGFEMFARHNSSVYCRRVIAGEKDTAAGGLGVLARA